MARAKKDREEKPGKPQTTPSKNGKIRHPHHQDYPSKVYPQVVQPKNHLQIEPHKEELHAHANHRHPHGLDHGDLLKEKNSQRNEQEEIPLPPNCQGVRWIISFMTPPLSPKEREEPYGWQTPPTPYHGKPPAP